ncbi:hypothetical protein BCR37DRAFT_392363 [Protomyces lactucae-debilis]|uniref:Uncharacterized protein n=1 Tax=Protomyces lactucae-debilis TaxID=2754530 RepID=A0A1Y2FJ13_PROLT|nr:uncharacterized protein BCR37DRAFT_392363 [Protomyces lactucae-debilis]ORY83919.1 hypothetical protein BCR37DRAFT_392363 [Protomyces lactucae-debilis]
MPRPLRRPKQAGELTNQEHRLTVKSAHRPFEPKVTTIAPSGTHEYAARPTRQGRAKKCAPRRSAERNQRAARPFQEISVNARPIHMEKQFMVAAKRNKVKTTRAAIQGSKAAGHAPVTLRETSHENEAALDDSEADASVAFVAPDEELPLHKKETVQKQNSTPNDDFREIDDWELSFEDVSSPFYSDQ